MSNEAIYENKNSEGNHEVGRIPQSPASIDYSDYEGSNIDQLSNAEHETYVSKLRDRNYPSTVCIHTTAVVGEQVLKIVDNFNTQEKSLFSSSEMNSEDSDSNLVNESIFTQHITLKFEDPNEADECYIKLKESIVQTQYNIEISYKTLSHPGNLYVRWVHSDTTEKDLRDIFEKFGELTTCKIVYDENNNSKGYGFINFVLKTSADNAIKDLNNKEIDGNRFYINHHISKMERLSKLEMEKILYTNLYVKNIPEDISIDELTELFNEHGVVESIFVPTLDNENTSDEESENVEKKLKGFGFVNYSNHDDAINAQHALNNYEIRSGRHLAVTKAQKRDRGDVTPSNTSVINDIGSFTRDFNRLRMFPLSSAAQAPLSQGDYYASSPRLGQPPLPDQYYYPAPRSATLNQLYTPPIKNGLPIAGPNYQDSNLYIKNLPLDIGDDELTELFEPFGEIVSAKVITSDGEHSKGYGFVCFKLPQHASRALLEMDNYGIDEEHNLHVSFAQRKDNRMGSNGIVHHYNQNHFNYGLVNQNRAGPLPIIPSHEQPQQAAQYSNVYPYYYYQGGSGYGQIPAPSVYPAGATIIPIAPPPIQQQQQAQQQQQQQSHKGNARQYSNFQQLQYVSPRLSNQTQIPQQLPHQSKVMPGYGVDYYGRVVTSSAPRHLPQQLHQQQGYQMPPQ